MQAVILAGGLGTRLSEETYNKPKPMVEVGGKPILWHILKIYSFHGINEFIICCGYKGYLIKEYFANYFLHNCDVTLDLSSNSIKVHSKKSEPWKVTLVDTGENTQTGGRLARVKNFIKGTFCFTYGDGLADINIQNLINYHIKSKKKATISAVKPPGRFGALELERDKVINFHEKPKGDGFWINGGFFVLEPSVFDLISDDFCIWEQEPLKKLSREGELNAYKHNGFWQPMDTLRDKTYLEKLWSIDQAPWKLWQ